MQESRYALAIGNYWSNRLPQELRRNAQTRLLGLRPWHLHAVDRPLYAIETDLTDGRVLRGARRFLERSESPRSLARLVDAAETDSHLDPLTAAPSTSRFLQTVVHWLKRVRDRGPSCE